MELPCQCDAAEGRGEGPPCSQLNTFISSRPSLFGASFAWQARLEPQWGLMRFGVYQHASIKGWILFINLFCFFFSFILFVNHQRLVFTSDTFWAVNLKAFIQTWRLMNSSGLTEFNLRPLDLHVNKADSPLQVYLFTFLLSARSVNRCNRADFHPCFWIFFVSRTFELQVSHLLTAANRLLKQRRLENTTAVTWFNSEVNTSSVGFTGLILLC